MGGEGVKGVRVWVWGGDEGEGGLGGGVGGDGVVKWEGKGC